MEIHVGKLIKNRLQETGMTKSEFARRINKTSQNVYDIFERKTIDTGLLLKISKILDFNFFERYSLTLNSNPSLLKSSEDTSETFLSANEMVKALQLLDQQMNDQKLEIVALKKEIAYLMEINGLLSGRRNIK
ncbi:MAG: helix-turn-helix domain-containing protein [Flavobacteriia bacterium]|jgi:plasmid maintenance system antidote protein VapI